MPVLGLRRISDLVTKIEVPKDEGYASDVLWDAEASEGHLQVEVFVVLAGGTMKARHHPAHMTSVICWSGRGSGRIADRPDLKVETWNAPCAPFAVKRYTAFVVPKGGLYEFTADARKDGEPESPCVLIVVHPLHGSDDELKTGYAQFNGQSTAAYDWVKDLDPLPDASPKDPETGEPIFQYDPDPAHRAKRMRIWGRDGIRKRQGGADIAKPEFHVVAYCFGAGQENPAHFHPYSVELMLGLTGETLTYTREKRWDRDGNPLFGWDETRSVATIRPGDTALVRVGNLHRYVNHTKDRSIVLAMQTPQPIMHTLEHETDF